MSVAVFQRPPLAQRELRSVLGQFATGVTVVAAGRRMPCGMTANSFASVSVDPPLVLVCVTRGSELCEAVVSEGSFGVSVLAAHQEDLARYFANHDRPRGAAQFAGVRWSPAPATGSPLIEGAVAWLDCTVAASYQGGDHEILIGAVQAAAADPEGGALLFFRGGYCRSPLDQPGRPGEPGTP
jgi:flavin reductase (DIM6/NTAB) family NADH-FMN oxidoreductase RutF